RGRRAAEQPVPVPGQIRVPGADADGDLTDDVERVAVEDANFALERRRQVELVAGGVDDHGTVRHSRTFAKDQTIGGEVEDLEPPHAADQEPVAVDVHGDTHRAAAPDVVARNGTKRGQVDGVGVPSVHPFRHVDAVAPGVDAVRVEG